jgi:hypothetical protein
MFIGVLYLLTPTYVSILPWGEPMIGKLAGVQVLFDRPADAAKQLGPAKMGMGGHSNGGRFWEKGDRTIYADCWHFDRQSYFIDYLSIENWTGLLSDLGSCGTLYRGIRGLARDTDVFRLLQKTKLPVWRKGNKILVSATYLVPKSMRVHSWQTETIEYKAGFSFRRHKLNRIQIFSSYDGTTELGE